MYQNIQVNHTNIKEYLKIAEERMLTDDVTEEDRQSHSYHCLNCGERMIPRMGVKRTRHFAHRGEDVHCGQETYLHKLAKLLIKEKFNQSQESVIC